MTGRLIVRSPRLDGRLAVILAAAILAGACGDPAGPARPTDPRAIVSDAVRATALLPSARVHAEMRISMGPGLGAGAGNGEMTMLVDADIDLVNRQLTGRSTWRAPAAFGGGGDQVSEMIVTRAATFTREANGRWMKIPVEPGAAGPTNEQIVRAIETLVADPTVRLELVEPVACSLGTCDHVLVHVGGARLLDVLGPMLGMPRDFDGDQAIPDLELDVRVDQGTSLLSEIRYAMTIQGTSTQLLLAISNPGVPVQIVPPPPALTDDWGENFGGFGGFGTTTILEEVGAELESPWPDWPEPSFEP